jgi:hypothetical protein
LPPPGRPAARSDRRARFGFWWGPLVGAAATVIVAAGLLIALLGWLERQADDQSGPEPPDVPTLIRSGKDALAEGKLYVAIRHFNHARQRAATHEGTLSAIELRDLEHLGLQTALLADLLRESPAEILQFAASLREDEWQVQFNGRYRGYALIFDDWVRRDAAGTYSLEVLEVRAPGEPARIDLAGLKVLKSIPLDQPRRLLFGARLASVAREPPGVWVIRFDPDSGVLITDEEAAKACCPQPLEPELQETLKRQSAWVGARP